MIRLTQREIKQLDLDICLIPEKVYQVDSLLVSEKQSIREEASVSDLFFMCHQLCHASKNLYNQALFYWRQQFIKNQTVLSYETLDKKLKQSQSYRALPAKVSQQTLKVFSQNIASYFALKKSEKLTSEEKKKVKLPNYYPSNKFKPNGLTTVTFTNQAISKTKFNQGKLLLSGTGLEIDLHQFSMINKLIKQGNFSFTNVQQVRITPSSRDFDKNQSFKIEIIHAKKIERVNNTVRYLDLQLVGDFSDFASIDTNVNDLCVVTRNQAFLYNLRPIKYINHNWNKKLAKLQSIRDGYKNQLEVIWHLEKQGNNPLTKETTEIIIEESKLQIKKIKKNIKRITTKRNRRIKTFIHQLSRQLINHLSQLEVKNLIWGKNVSLKKEINLGAKNNLNFVQIPFNLILEHCKYKAHLSGINFFTVEESYTSKTSFLDKEFLHSYKTKSKPAKNHTFLGKRKSRGLFVCQDGTQIHADVNGALNIARKVMGQMVYHLVNLSRIKGSCPIRIKVKQN